MQRIAAEARASTATHYRRWGGKPRLVVEALMRHQPPPLIAVDTGTLRGDLSEGARRLAAMSQGDDALVSGLAHAARSDPELAEAMKATLGQPTVEAAHLLIGRAVARGEIKREAAAVEFLPELLMAATVTRRLVSGETPSDDYLERYVDSVLLPALGVHS